MIKKGVGFFMGGFLEKIIFFVCDYIILCLFFKLQC